MLLFKLSNSTLSIRFWSTHKQNAQQNEIEANCFAKQCDFCCRSMYIVAFFFCAMRKASKRWALKRDSLLLIKKINSAASIGLILNAVVVITVDNQLLRNRFKWCGRLFWVNGQKWKWKKPNGMSYNESEYSVVFSWIVAANKEQQRTHRRVWIPGVVLLVCAHC